MDLKEFIISFLSIALIGTSLFLIFRAVVLWYWKINRIVELLEDISIKLNNLPELESKKPETPSETSK